jgi:hemolysin III
MKNLDSTKHYTPCEERINILTHALGLVLSIVALLLLIQRAIQFDHLLSIISFSIFGVSLILLYAASTAYHSAVKPIRRSRLRILDHASIYILIAGSYTPFTLITLHGTTGWVVFGITWGLALTGIILKLFFTGKYDLLSTIMYVFMGWVIVFVIKPLINNLPLDGLLWLIVGGMAYTIGAILYSIRKLKFNHGIFHVFVLAGSFCHFMAVYFYVVPNG